MNKNNYKILGLVPARGGSKGIKNKNIIDLAGKPLIAYVVEALKKSETVNRIVCTTDSELIAEVAKQYGAEVPFYRPAELAQDTSPTYPALVHALQKLEELEGYKPDYVVTAQPTYPLLQPRHIDEAARKAIEMKADSVITAVALEHDCHPYNIRHVLPDGRVRFWKEEEHYLYPTRQSKPKFYTFGNIFVTSYETLIKHGRLEGDKNYLIEIEPIYHLDINTQDDLDRIEYYLKSQERKRKNEKDK